jgi:hypothetical protein
MDQRRRGSMNDGRVGVRADREVVLPDGAVAGDTVVVAGRLSQ